MKSRSSIWTCTGMGLVWSLLAVTVMSSFSAAAESDSKTKKSDQLQSPTHRQVRMITPKVKGNPVELHTMATNADGLIVAGVSSGSQGMVLLIDSEGETKSQWNLELTPTGVTVAPDGTIFVAGSGRIAELGQDGEVTKMIDSPHVGDIDELKKKTADAIRQSRKQMSASFGKQIEMLKERIADIEKKEEADRSKLETAQLDAFEQQLEMIEAYAAPEDADIPDEYLNSAIQQSLNVTSMAASDKDVFLCAMDPGGGGYSVWRVGRDLDTESAEMIMDGLRGCCGQMDIQCCNGQLVVSENTNFKIAVYDRNGRAQNTFGRRDRTSRGGFGSCCNPMNSLPMADGTVLTAESSIGHIKRFDMDGNLVAYIGKASIGGGCKHCALGYDEENDLYYMMYEDKNAICVLANNADTPMSVAEQELEQRRIDFLAQAAGKWDVDEGKADESSTGGLLSLFGGGRGGSSQHPVTSLQIESNGNAKILDGMYKAYGDVAGLELMQSDSEEEFAFALAIDQVRFLEGTWKFESDDSATVSFQGLTSVKMKRDAAADKKCAGANCNDEKCADEDCPNHNKPAEADVADIVVAIDSVEEAMEDFDGSFDQAYEFSSTALTPKFEYKLVGSGKLGDEPESALNELGADGWEYCGRLGKKLMFKRAVYETGALLGLTDLSVEE